MSFDYDIALSFAGEDRLIVDALALALVKRGVRVFYDRYEEGKLWGKDLAEELYEVYSKRAQYCLMIISSSYLEKRWPRHERRSALERQIESDPEYILPLRLDDTELPGLPSTIKYIKMGPDEADRIADLVVRKLGRGAAEGEVPLIPTRPTSTSPSPETVRRLLDRHAAISILMFPDRSRGYWAIHSSPREPVLLTRERLDKTFLDISKPYSETLHYSDPPTAHPDGYTRALRARSTPRDPGKTIDAVTCYGDGHLVTEGLFRARLEDEPAFNPSWFLYEIHRHLQLAKELLEGTSTNLDLVIHFENIHALKWEVYRGGQVWLTHPYSGYHRDVTMRVQVSEIYGRDRWNLKMDVATVALEHVARIFGLSQLPQPYWNGAGQLEYAQFGSR